MGLSIPGGGGFSANISLSFVTFNAIIIINKKPIFQFFYGVLSIIQRGKLPVICEKVKSLVSKEHGSSCYECFALPTRHGHEF